MIWEGGLSLPIRYIGYLMIEADKWILFMYLIASKYVGALLSYEPAK